MAEEGVVIKKAHDHRYPKAWYFLGAIETCRSIQSFVVSFISYQDIIFQLCCQSQHAGSDV